MFARISPARTHRTLAGSDSGGRSRVRVPHIVTFWSEDRHAATDDAATGSEVLKFRCLDLTLTQEHPIVDVTCATRNLSSDN